jgi:2-phospho-L-lactate guanylyltransferase (CobY/MobA/RfbA family)
LQRELRLLNQAQVISRVLVVSSDPTIWGIARRNGAQVEEEPQSLGLNVAVARGKAIAAENGAAAVLILPVDLPFISVADIDLMVNSSWGPDMSWPAAVGSAPYHQGSNQDRCPIVICSDEDGDGTNALLVVATQDFSFRFGPGSFQNHIQEARKRGMAVHIISAPGLGFDIDNEDDWLTYQASRVGY